MTIHLKPGQKVGELTYLEVAGKDKWGHIMVIVQCSCGNKTVMRRSDFARGHTLSCGCRPVGFPKGLYSKENPAPWWDKEAAA